MHMQVKRSAFHGSRGKAWKIPKEKGFQFHVECIKCRQINENFTYLDKKVVEAADFWFDRDQLFWNWQLLQLFISVYFLPHEAWKRVWNSPFMKRQRERERI